MNVPDAVLRERPERARNPTWSLQEDYELYEEMEGIKLVLLRNYYLLDNCADYLDLKQKTKYTTDTNI